jgi:hypothetical protein
MKISGVARLIVWLLQIYNYSYAEITGVSNFEIELRSKLYRVRDCSAFGLYAIS